MKPKEDIETENIDKKGEQNEFLADIQEKMKTFLKFITTPDSQIEEQLQKEEEILTKHYNENNRILGLRFEDVGLSISFRPTIKEYVEAITSTNSLTDGLLKLSELEKDSDSYNNLKSKLDSEIKNDTFQLVYFHYGEKGNTKNDELQNLLIKIYNDNI